MIALLTETTTTLPGGLEIAAGMAAPLQGLLLAIATLILEDPTAIAAGLLARSGVVSYATAIVGTGIGIFVGDLGLYGLGAAAARGARATGWVRRRLPDAQVARLGRWFDASGWKAIVFSRFVSGSRLPIYLGAGFVGAGFARFALWTALAVAVWTPLIVVGTALVGGSIMLAARGFVGDSIWAWIALAVAVVLLLRGCMLIATGRRRLFIGLLRAMRFEFWPTWAVYAPVVPFLALQALRHGFARTLTAVNPCWPDSGVVGESKQAGLDAFDPAFTAPSFRVAPAADGTFGGDLIVHEAVAALDAKGWSEGWRKPVIVKPDAGQRGFGVRIVRSEAEFRAALRAARAPVVVQRYAPGACEVGLFFIRDPGTDGRLFSICEKHLPSAVGDGRSTLRELIARHPRLRLQEEVFFARLGDQPGNQLDRIPAAGEVIALGIAGNHAQGCLFVDGERLRTPALEAWLRRACAPADGAQRGFKHGFNYGRLDVRFDSEADCMAGVGGVILEANGITSESTNMYDPSLGAFKAWAIMRAHWRAAFLIGAANRAGGTRGIGLREVLTRWRTWRRSARTSALAD